VKGAIGADAVEAAVMERAGKPDKKYHKLNNPSGRPTTLPLAIQTTISRQNQTANVAVEIDAGTGAVVELRAHLKGAQKPHKSLRMRKRARNPSQRRKRLLLSNSVKNNSNNKQKGLRNSPRRNVSPVVLCSIADQLGAIMTMPRRSRKMHLHMFPLLLPLSRHM
jgi:hypothetical protein